MAKDVFTLALLMDVMQGADEEDGLSMSVERPLPSVKVRSYLSTKEVHLVLTNSTSTISQPRLSKA
jgi:Asp-tRNA(Asn)/Glu-tRNA(Gln) amidotransferase A subunit family amidase